MWKKVQANLPDEDYDLYLQGKKVSSKFRRVKFLDECFKQNLKMVASRKKKDTCDASEKKCLKCL